MDIALHQELAALKQKLARIERSKSWRYTKPFRWLGRVCREMGKPRQAVHSMAQAKEDDMVRSMLPVDAPCFLVEVGAHNGLHLSNSFSFIAQGWKAILIEPHPLLFEQLQQRYADNANIHCVRKACAESAGIRPLYLPKEEHLGTSTLCTDDTPWFKAIRSDDAIPVEVDTLTAILTEQECPHDFSLLLIDAEGMDYEVLLGLDSMRFRPRVIVTEECMWNAEKHNAKYELLTKRGYRLEHKAGCNTIWRKAGV